jgi:hypothetical protein
MDDRQETTGKPRNPLADTPAAGAANPACSLTSTANRRGLECPRCGCRHFHVLYTRAAIGGRILRRRECRHCGRRLTTYEKGDE